MSLFTKQPIPYGEKRNCINEIIDNLKRQIVGLEVDMRYLERREIVGVNLSGLEDMLTKDSKIKEELEGRLEVSLDIQKEIKDK